MRCALVILNWNTKAYLQRFLPPLLDSAKGLAEVVVADNCSSDGSAEMMEADFPGVRLLRFDRNYGFTGGYNKAFKELRAAPGGESLEYFLLLNSDIEVTPGWLEPLLEWMDSHPGCAVCGPKLLSYQNRSFFEYAGAAGGFLDYLGYPFCRGRVLGKVEKDEGQYDSPSRVFWVSGACLLARAADYESSGGLDERFFAHFEEIDLCWRLLLQGREVCVVPQSKVYHLGGGTLPKSSPMKARLNFRNSLLALENNLAKTLATNYLDEGISGDAAAELACRKARRLLLLRRFLDILAALAYLLTGKVKWFRAVLDARKEFRALRSGIVNEEVLRYARAAEEISPVELYPRSIVLASLLKGKRIFAFLRETL